MSQRNVGKIEDQRMTKLAHAFCNFLGQLQAQLGDVPKANSDLTVGILV